MLTISPSLLASDFLNLEKEIQSLNKIKDLWLHLDIMDGHFVPNLTFGEPITKKIASISKHPSDAHLMVTNPEFHIDQMKDYGLHNITFHLEAVSDPLDLIQKAKNHYPSVGISIKPKTKVSDIPDEVLKAVDLVLVMSVEPGFGGQSFIPESLTKLEQLVEKKSELKTELTLQIDGGINQETGEKARKHGAQNLVAGSFVFKTGKDYYQARIDELRGV